MITQAIVASYLTLHFIVTIYRNYNYFIHASRIVSEALENSIKQLISNVSISYVHKFLNNHADSKISGYLVYYESICCKNTSVSNTSEEQVNPMMCNC